MQMNLNMEMTYAAIYGGGRTPTNFPGFSPKVSYIFKLFQFIFPAKAFNGEGYSSKPRHKWHGNSLKAIYILTHALYGDA